MLKSTKADLAIGKKTLAGKAVKFPDLAPGPYTLTVSTPGGKIFTEDFELPKRRRVSVRIKLEGEKVAGGSLKQAVHDTAYVLLKGTAYVLVVAALAPLLPLALLDTDTKDNDRDRYQQDSLLDSQQVIAESKRIERRARRLRKKLK